MRVVREIQKGSCKITVFSWNNRYLVKLEEGMLEQTFKVNEADFLNDEEVLTLIDDQFLSEASDRFRQMSNSLLAAQKRADNNF